MVRILVDRSQVDDIGNDPVPEGVYDARIDTEDCEMRQASSGDPFVFINFVIESGEYDGYVVDDLFMLAGKGAFKIENMMENLELIDEDEEDEDQIPLDTDELHGMRVRIEVEEDTYKGRETNNIVSVMLPEDDLDQDEFEVL